MASADRFAEIVEEQIPEIVNEAIPINTKTLEMLTLEMQNLKITILRSLITCQRKAIDSL